MRNLIYRDVTIDWPAPEKTTSLQTLLLRDCKPRMLTITSHVISDVLTFCHVLCGHALVSFLLVSAPHGKSFSIK